MRYAKKNVKNAQRRVQECKELLYDKTEDDHKKEIRHKHALSCCTMAKSVSKQAFVWYKQTGEGDALPALNRLSYTADSLHRAVQKAVNVQSGQYGAWSIAWMASNRAVAVGMECLKTIEAERN